MEPSVNYQWSDGITQSLLFHYMLCPRRFAIATHGYTEGPKFAIELGSAGHNALEIGRTGEYQYDDIGRSRIEQIEAYLSIIVPAYRKYYGRPASGKAEYIFKVPFAGTFLRGKIDRVTTAVIFEYKFNSRISVEDADARLALDFQTLFYITALHEENKKYKPLKAIYDIIRYPTIKETDSSLSVIGKTADALQHPEAWFYRWETAFTVEDIEFFKTELRQKLREMMERTVWYRNECSCMMRFRCPYMDFCASNNIEVLNNMHKKVLFSELSI